MTVQIKSSPAPADVLYKAFFFGKIGNHLLHVITQQKEYTLRVDLADFANNTRYAEYSNMTVGALFKKYELQLGAYRGDAGIAKVFVFLVAGILVTLGVVPCSTKGNSVVRRTSALTLWPSGGRSRAAHGAAAFPLCPALYMTGHFRSLHEV